MAFSNTEKRYDIYAFYNYAENSDHIGRKLNVIIYEISSYLRYTLISLMLLLRIKHVFFFALFFICTAEFVFYMLFFGRGTDAYLILIISFMSLITVFWKRLWKQR